MSYAVITTKIDPRTKKEAQITAEALGMPLSVIIKAFLKQFIKTKTVSFSVYGNGEPSEYLIKTLQQAQKNRKEGKGSPVFDNAEDAIAYLKKQGI
ncbi:type II toxin-antitoxin system RelB/DinJ family antitoxin [Candidatus Microgenomates bacterium]|nr:type II toxin-antitoxin system RelB/DinJ family antitoxin [Candidatus Microgenomates bacterium]